MVDVYALCRVFGETINHFISAKAISSVHMLCMWAENWSTTDAVVAAVVADAAADFVAVDDSVVHKIGLQLLPD